jgi:hypothetical protein
MGLGTYLVLLSCIFGVSALQVFSPSAFSIRRQVGQLGFATETEWQYYGGRRNPLDPSQPARTVEASGISVRLFDATLYRDGGRILLKQFLPMAVDIGERELAVYTHLYERDGDGSTKPAAMQQAATLLGHLRTDRSFESATFREEWSRALPSTPPPGAGELWLIFRWEGLSTVAGFARAAQEKAWWDFDGRLALAARKKFLKVVTARTLQVVNWLHTNGVVHRSLGSSSLILSTYDQTLPARLYIKAIDLGFASSASLLPAEDISQTLSRGATGPLNIIPFLARDDLHALAYVLLELILTSSRSPYGGADSQGGTGRPTDLQSLKRIVEDLFAGDVAQFRDYCLPEPEWALAVELLDEQARVGCGGGASGLWTYW